MAHRIARPPVPKRSGLIARRLRSRTLAVVLAAPLLLSAGALLAPSAQAYVRIDDFCILRVTTPHFDSGHQYVDGAVDCTSAGSFKTQIQAGPQVYNSSTGLWYNCCVNGQPFPAQTETTSYNELTYDAAQTAVSGHTYRTWDYGYVYYDGNHNTYASSSVTY
jgi:hypothetical protein